MLFCVANRGMTVLLYFPSQVRKNRTFPERMGGMEGKFEILNSPRGGSCMARFIKTYRGAKIRDPISVIVNSSPVRTEEVIYSVILLIYCGYTHSKMQEGQQPAKDRQGHLSWLSWRTSTSLAPNTTSEATRVLSSGLRLGWILRRSLGTWECVVHSSGFSLCFDWYKRYKNLLWNR